MKPLIDNLSKLFLPSSDQSHESLREILIPFIKAVWSLLKEKERSSGKNLTRMEVESENGIHLIQIQEEGFDYSERALQATYNILQIINILVRHFEPGLGRIASAVLPFKESPIEFTKRLMTNYLATNLLVLLCNNGDSYGDSLEEIFFDKNDIQYNKIPTALNGIIQILKNLSGSKRDVRALEMTSLHDVFRAMTIAVPIEDENTYVVNFVLSHFLHAVSDREDFLKIFQDPFTELVQELSNYIDLHAMGSTIQGASAAMKALAFALDASREKVPSAEYFPSETIQAKLTALQLSYFPDRKQIETVTLPVGHYHPSTGDWAIAKRALVQQVLQIDFLLAYLIRVKRARQVFKLKMANPSLPSSNAAEVYSILKEESDLAKAESTHRIAKVLEEFDWFGKHKTALLQALQGALFSGEFDKCKDIIDSNPNFKEPEQKDIVKAYIQAAESLHFSKATLHDIETYLKGRLPDLNCLDKISKAFETIEKQCIDVLAPELKKEETLQDVVQNRLKEIYDKITHCNQILTIKKVDQQFNPALAFEQLDKQESYHETYRFLFESFESPLERLENAFSKLGRLKALKKASEATVKRAIQRQCYLIYQGLHYYQSLHLVYHFFQNREGDLNNSLSDPNLLKPLFPDLSQTEFDTISAYASGEISLITDDVLKAKIQNALLSRMNIYGQIIDKVLRTLNQERDWAPLKSALSEFGFGFDREALFQNLEYLRTQQQQASLRIYLPRTLSNYLPYQKPSIIYKAAIEGNLPIQWQSNWLYQVTPFIKKEDFENALARKNDLTPKDRVAFGTSNEEKIDTLMILNRFLQLLKLHCLFSKNRPSNTVVINPEKHLFVLNQLAFSQDELRHIECYFRYPELDLDDLQTDLKQKAHLLIEAAIHDILPSFLISKKAAKTIAIEALHSPEQMALGLEEFLTHRSLNNYRDNIASLYLAILEDKKSGLTDNLLNEAGLNRPEFEALCSDLSDVVQQINNRWLASLVVKPVFELEAPSSRVFTTRSHLDPKQYHQTAFSQLTTALRQTLEELCRSHPDIDRQMYPVQDCHRGEVIAYVNNQVLQGDSKILFTTWQLASLLEQLAFNVERLQDFKLKEIANPARLKLKSKASIKNLKAILWTMLSLFPGIVNYDSKAYKEFFTAIAIDMDLVSMLRVTYTAEDSNRLFSFLRDFSQTLDLKDIDKLKPKELLRISQLFFGIIFVSVGNSQPKNQMMSMVSYYLKAISNQPFFGLMTLETKKRYEKLVSWPRILNQVAKCLPPKAQPFISLDALRAYPSYSARFQEGLYAIAKGIDVHLLPLSDNNLSFVKPFCSNVHSRSKHALLAWNGSIPQAKDTASLKQPSANVGKATLYLKPPEDTMFIQLGKLQFNQLDQLTLEELRKLLKAYRQAIHSEVARREKPSLTNHDNLFHAHTLEPIKDALRNSRAVVSDVALIKAHLVKLEALSESINLPLSSEHFDGENLNKRLDALKALRQNFNQKLQSLRNQYKIQVNCQRLAEFNQALKLLSEENPKVSLSKEYFKDMGIFDQALKGIDFTIDDGNLVVTFNHNKLGLLKQRISDSVQKKQRETQDEIARLLSDLGVESIGALESLNTDFTKLINGISDTLDKRTWIALFWSVLKSLLIILCQLITRIFANYHWNPKQSDPFPEHESSQHLRAIMIYARQLEAIQSDSSDQDFKEQDASAPTVSEVVDSDKPKKHGWISFFLDYANGFIATADESRKVRLEGLLDSRQQQQIEPTQSKNQTENLQTDNPENTAYAQTGNPEYSAGSTKTENTSNTSSNTSSFFGVTAPQADKETVHSANVP